MLSGPYVVQNFGHLSCDEGDYSMKILIVYHSGALQNALTIFGALVANRSIELTVIAPEWVAADKVYDPSGRLEVKRESHANGYRLLPLPLVDPKRYQLGFEGEPLRKVIKDFRADVLHVWDEPLSYCLLHVARLRFLVSRKSKVLFYGFQNTPFKWDALGRVIWKTAWTQVAGGAAANSEALTNLRQAGFPQRRPLERIFWGIPTDVFKSMDSRALKKELALDCEHIVGFVGRLVPEKGLAFLLAAIRRLPTTIHLLIIGSGPMRAELEMRSTLPGLSERVHLYDVMPSESLAKYVNCMDVLAVPSVTTPHWKEQYGRVIGEAMACGVPVVGSDSGAIPEVIASAGLVVPEGNISALAEALQTAIFDEERRPEFIKQGLQRVEQELSIKAMSQRLLGFYSRILGT